MTFVIFTSATVVVNNTTAPGHLPFSPLPSSGICMSSQAVGRLRTKYLVYLMWPMLTECARHCKILRAKGLDYLFSPRGGDCVAYGEILVSDTDHSFIDLTS